MTAEERKLYDSIMHGLRSRGWSRIDAENMALNAIAKKRTLKAPVE